jgi:hypothetical protein
MPDRAKASPARATPDRIATDDELAAITTVVLERDTDAFAAADWSQVADDFDEDAFVGYAGGDDRDDTWQVAYPTLAAYRDEWIRQAKEMKPLGEPAEIARQIRAACCVTEVRVNGDRAVARKQFDGEAFGQRLHWQTYYFLRHADDAWRITGFVGYLPPDAP